MGHRANYVIVDGHTARVYADHWGGMSAALAFAEGAARAVECAEGCEQTSELMDDTWAEAGFLVDRKRRRALVFCSPASDFVGFDDLLNGVPDDDAARQRALDEGLARSPDEWLVAIADGWPDYDLRFVDGVTDLADYLDETKATIEHVAPTQDAESPGWSADHLDDVMPDRISDEERCAQLGGVSSAQRRSGLLSIIGMVLTVLIVLVPALLVRLLTWPWRRRWEESREDALDARLGRARAHAAGVVRATSAVLEQDPDDVDALFERGAALLELHAYGQAEVDLDRCVGLLEGTHDAGKRQTLGGALHNRGRARRGMRCHALADQDLERAQKLGIRRPFLQRLASPFIQIYLLFRLVAGLI